VHKQLGAIRALRLEDMIFNIIDHVSIIKSYFSSQFFCMDMDDLAKRAKGKTTFWGEIDRQNVLPSPDPQVGGETVQ